MKRLLTLLSLIFLIQTLHAQQIEWRYQLNNYLHYSRAQFITKDKEHNIYIGGNFEFDCSQPDAEFSSNCKGFFIEKRNSSGQMLWKDSAVTRWGRALGLMSFPPNRIYFSVAISENSITLSSGAVLNKTPEALGCNLIRYDHTGIPQSVTQNWLCGLINVNNEIITWVDGHTLKKIDTLGNTIWQKKMARYHIGNGRKADSNNVIIQVGSSSDPDSLKKVDIEGNVVWSVPIPGYFRSFDVTDEGETYLSGAFLGGAYLQKLDKHGNEIWYKPMSNGAYTTLLYDKQHSKLAGTKYFSGPCHFYRMDLNGNVQDSLSLQTDVAINICQDGDSYYIVGEDKTYVQGHTAVVLKISDQVMSVPEKAGSSKNDIIVFPNPTRDLVTVKFQENINEKISARITNLTGQLISENNFLLDEAHTIKVPLNSLSKGLYLLSLSYNGRVSVCKVSVE